MVASLNHSGVMAEDTRRFMVMASDGSIVYFSFRARLERLRKQVNLGSYPIYLFTFHMTLGKVLNLPKTFVYEMGTIINLFTA